jgi:hypothetical protein
MNRVKVLTILLFFGLGLAVMPVSPNMACQGCVDCAWPCTMTLNGYEYGDLGCSCPTSSTCFYSATCQDCVWDGWYYCYDYMNECGYDFRDNMWSSCGCGGVGD